MDSAPKPDPKSKEEITPVSSSNWMAGERKYYLSNSTYDIGEFLGKTDIKPFQIITLYLKKVYINGISHIVLHKIAQ